MTPTLIIGNHLSRHGRTPDVCEELARLLRRDGWPVETASSRLNPAARLAELTAGVWSRRARFRVAQIDVFSGRAFKWAEAAAFSLALARKPFILTLHGGDLPRFARTQSRRLSRLLTRAFAVTAPSEYLRGRFRAVRNDIRLIPNGIEVSRYRFRLRERPRPRLIWMRTVHRVYDPVTAVETLAELRRMGRDAVLTMVGPASRDGSRSAALDRSRSRGLVDRVRLTGGVAKRDTPLVFEQGDVFLNTSRIDNQPVSVIEAMASGLCVVSTNVGGVPHLIDDGVDGLLVPAGDPQAMARAIARILDEPGLAVRLSSNARLKAERFDWERVLPQWKRLLDRAAEEARP